jgi:hypothetical protein
VTIFSEQDISSSLVYGELMEKINLLHNRMGEPTMGVRGPTTEVKGFDAHEGRRWEEEKIGDWKGVDAGKVSRLLQEEYESVLDAVNLGRFPYYYHQGDAWEEFEDEVYGIILDFNEGRAWEIASQENFERIERRAMEVSE